MREGKPRAQFGASNPNVGYPYVVFNAGERATRARTTDRIELAQGEEQQVQLPGVASMHIKRPGDTSSVRCELTLNSLTNDPVSQWRDSRTCVMYTGLTLRNTTQRPLAVYQCNGGWKDSREGESYRATLQPNQETYVEGYEPSASAYDVAIKVYEVDGPGRSRSATPSLNLEAHNPWAGEPYLQVFDGLRKTLDEHQTVPEWMPSRKLEAWIHRDADSDCKHFKVTINKLAVPESK